MAIQYAGVAMESLPQRLPVLDTKEVARQLDTGERTVINMLQDGVIQGFRIKENGPWKVLQEDVDAFILERKRAAAEAVKRQK